MPSTILETLIVIAKERLDGVWKPSGDLARETEIDRRGLGFDMRNWMRPEADCGYSGCIIGHALMDERLCDTLREPDRGIGNLDLTPRTDFTADMAAELELDLIPYASRLKAYLFMPDTYACLGLNMENAQQIMREFIFRAELLLRTKKPKQRAKLISNSLDILEEINRHEI